jgi:short-subunit dehydrogenase
MKKAIVVGATSGIGNELAKILVKNNYKVGVTGRRKAELEKLQKRSPKNYVISNFDCTTENNTHKLNALANQLGDLDLLIISSGIGTINEDLDVDLENETNLLNVNAFTEIVNWGFHYFNKKSKGHLVAISSIAGIRGSRIAPAYNASKAYQINYLEGIRQKVFKTKKPIYITDVRPGFVNTDMLKGDGLFWVAIKQKAAVQIFNSIKRKKSICYVTKRWLLIALLLKIIPNTIYKRF